MPFTVEFKDDGTISKVFEGGINSLGKEVKKPAAGKGGTCKELSGRTLHNINHVTIFTTSAPPQTTARTLMTTSSNKYYTCIWQGGKLICLP